MMNKEESTEINPKIHNLFPNGVVESLTPIETLNKYSHLLSPYAKLVIQNHIEEIDDIQQQFSIWFYGIKNRVPTSIIDYELFKYYKEHLLIKNNEKFNYVSEEPDISIKDEFILSLKKDKENAKEALKIIAKSYLNNSGIQEEVLIEQDASYRQAIKYLNKV